MAADSRQDEDSTVRHLVELGYVDPDEVAALEAKHRAQREAELRRAIELNGQGHGQQAVALLIALGADHPDWSSPHLVLAEIHYRAGDWPKTGDELDWLAHRNVVTPRLAAMVGAMALARRDLPTALEELDYACHVEPTLAGLHSLLGTTLLRLGRRDEAEDALRLAIEQNPADAHALDGLAAIAIVRSEYEVAADLALQALEHDMRLFRAHYHLGIALAHLNRPDAAVTALETCARLEPLRAAPYYWLSRIAERQLRDAERANVYRTSGREIVRRRCVRRKQSLQG